MNIEQVKEAMDMLNIFADSIRENISLLEEHVKRQEENEIKKAYELLLDTEINRIYVIEEIIHKLESD
ncbi:MAG TPA: hypothetical protein VLD64_06725 [Nitrosarchaeum sp.]|jgi:hypothetical protein|nr:hypothetical protein [Nitrosarchaeum sp.]